MQDCTRVLHALGENEETGAVSVPIYQTSTFVQEAPGQNKGYDYSRSNNPTRASLEQLIATLENGHSAYAFGSGLAAVDAVVKLLSAGDEIVAVDDIYGGAFRSFTHIYEKFGIGVHYVDATDTVNVERAITAKTKLIWLETPTNPTLKICDIAAICNVAKQRDCLVVVDSTFASPALQKPLELGADLVLHSATKYLGGHSDVIAGAVVCKTEALAERIKFIQNATGSVLGPWDSWLIIRGIQTLELRISKQCDSALALARWLSEQEEVKQVYYPGLPGHKNHHIAKKQQRKFGAVVSFSLKDDLEENAVHFVQSTSLFKLAESLGGVKSLLCVPGLMTHKSTPREVRRTAGIHDSLIRLSIGIEDVEDLKEDLRQALALFSTKAPGKHNLTVI
jgi:cystathionine beta-lyase